MVENKYLAFSIGLIFLSGSTISGLLNNFFAPLYIVGRWAGCKVIGMFWNVLGSIVLNRYEGNDVGPVTFLSTPLSGFVCLSGDLIDSSNSSDSNSDIKISGYQSVTFIFLWIKFLDLSFYLQKHDVLVSSCLRSELCRLHSFI